MHTSNIKKCKRGGFEVDSSKLIKSNNKAFTLIELLVVIAILAILVLLATSRFLGQTDKASVTGGRYVGGLLGEALSSNIKESYAIGNVDGGLYTGGLIGRMTFHNNGDGSTLEDSYSTGNVNGGDGSGGLVGSFNGGIYRSYSTGRVSGKNDGDKIEGLVGSRKTGWYKGEIVNSFFDKDTSGQSRHGDEGKNTSEMQDKSTFTNWDFENIWKIEPGNYPTLINNP